MKNPEANIQNERIKDLQEKNAYILDIVKEQNQRISDLEKRIDVVEKKPINKFKSVKKLKHRNDTINVKIFEGQILNKKQ